MDSHHHHHLHHFQQQQQQQQQQPPVPQQNHQNLMMPTNSNNSYSAPPGPHPISSAPMMSPQYQQHHFQQNSSVGDVSRFQLATFNPEPVRQMAAEGSEGGLRLGGEQAKKKRGRPRKYSPEGSGIGLELSANGGEHSGGGGNVGSGDPAAKKIRGRPLGSGKKQLDALGTMGVGFTPHVISVKAGEDIASKITSFAQQGPRTVCILSATGTVCNVTLRQAGTSSVTYKGRFEILSLTGSFYPSDNHSRTAGLSVSLAGSDGRVVGGTVAGMLMAASTIQVVVGSFISDFKKQKPKLSSPAPSTTIHNFSAPAPGGASSPSQGASTESSEGNHDSPPDNTPGSYKPDNGPGSYKPDNGPGSYSNASQPMQNMGMYSPISWPNCSINMPPN